MVTVLFRDSVKFLKALPSRERTIKLLVASLHANLRPVDFDALVCI